MRSRMSPLEAAPQVGRAGGAKAILTSTEILLPDKCTDYTCLVEGVPRGYRIFRLITPRAFFT